MYKRQTFSGVKRADVISLCTNFGGSPVKSNSTGWVREISFVTTTLFVHHNLAISGFDVLCCNFSGDFFWRESGRIGGNFRAFLHNTPTTENLLGRTFHFNSFSTKKMTMLLAVDTYVSVVTRKRTSNAF